MTIGIKAPWGAGKTSLMRMIRARLDPHPDSTLHPVDEVKPISNKDVLRATRESRQERTVVVGDLEASSASDRRATVWFNAWMYQSAEQVWAGLADAIISQLTARMPRRERERFWAQLNLRRIDGSVVRRRIYLALIEKLLPLALMFAGTLVVALAVLLIGGTAQWARITAGSTGIVSTVLFALASARKRQRFLAE
ncbi:MAG: P-loop NTPase fold protein, partial [Solirubrobacteraceae bacterium]